MSVLPWGLALRSRIERPFVPRAEQVYGREWTVADQADLVGDFADRLASAK
jgi:hypothetical protein